MTSSTTTTNILFRRPGFEYNKYADDVSVLTAVVETGTLFYPFGSRVSELADQLRAEFGVAGCTMVSSGTAAVHVALGAVGVDYGDEVITTPLTDSGTIIPILLLGAVPVFADVDGHTGMITPATVGPLITERTRAILVVHYGGFPADVDGLRAVARAHRIALLEDCAQAQGAQVGGQPVGTFGNVAAFSTNDTKHVSCGDGGFVLTTTHELARRARLFHDKGFDRNLGTRDPELLAPNYRMTELQAALLIRQWPRLADRVSRRRAFAARFDGLLERYPYLRPLKARPNSTGSYFSYLFAVAPEAPFGRDELCSALRLAGAPAHAGNLFDVMYRLKIFGRALPRYFSHVRHPDYTAVRCASAEMLHASMIRVEMCETYAEPELQVIRRVVDEMAGRRTVVP